VEEVLEVVDDVVVTGFVDASFATGILAINSVLGDLYVMTPVLGL
jgi:hypothetical protein